MAINPAATLIRYENVAEGVPIVVNLPLFAKEEAFVFYGEHGYAATLNVDYTLDLDEVGYATFTITPLLSLITKITDMIAADPTERNTIVVMRILPYSTTSTPQASRFSDFVSREFDRITMKFQQIGDTLLRTFRLSRFTEGNYDLTIPEWSAGKALAWHTTLKKIVNSDDAVFQGPAGAPGVGVPAGGTAGQVLAKIDGTNYNTQWITSAALTDGDKGDIVVAGGGTSWTFDPAVVTAFAKTVLDDANAAAMLTTLGVSAFVQTLLDDANAATFRGTLGLGTVATLNTGTGAGNVPVLDGAGLLDTAIMPAIAITDVFVVASQAAMLALTAQKGDIAIRTDLNKSFALSTNSPGTLADWKELLTPTDAVLSVAGLTGAITAVALKAALAIVPADLGNATALSVLGRSVNSAGAYADIAAAADDRIFARTASTLSWVQATYAMIASGAIAAAGHFMANTASRLLTAAAVWADAAEVAITYAATLPLDLATFLNAATCVLTGNTTLGNPTNYKGQQAYTIWFTATGATRTVSLGTNFKKGSSVEAFPINVATTETVGVHCITRSSTVTVVTGVTRYTT